MTGATLKNAGVPQVQPSAQHIALIRRFFDRLFPDLHNFDVTLWDGTPLRRTPEARFGVVLRSPGVLRRMFSPPIELSLAEAHIRDEFDVQGDLVAAFRAFQSITEHLVTPGAIFELLRILAALPAERGATRQIWRKQARLSGARHSIARDRAAVQYHYDLGNDFYALWLDKRMVYSCAYFPTGAEDLDTAQEAKLEHICRKLRLKPGDRLLDIGCGWGGLVIYAAQRYGVTALGVTLSKQQHELANQRIAAAGLADRVEVRLQDYRELADESFDKITSVGMFEHVGRGPMPAYFEHVHRLLKPGGLFLNHGISVHPTAPGMRRRPPWEAFAKRYILGWGLFSQRYIFPDGELMPLSEVNLLAERTGFEVRDVENLREHYALTTRHWAKRLEEQRDRVIRLTDETLYRIWRLYLAGATYGFEIGASNVNQTLLAKPVRGHVDLPMSRRDLYVS